MQNTVRWRSNQLDGDVVGSFWGTPSDANVEDSDCTVRMLLFISMPRQECEKHKSLGLTMSSKTR